MTRPKTVSDCPDGPCPWVGCRHHNAIDITPAGSIRLRIASGSEVVSDVDDVDIDALLEGETCSLRVAADGEHSLEEVGEALGCTRQRVQQIEVEALEKMRNATV